MSLTVLRQRSGKAPDRRFPVRIQALAPKYTVSPRSLSFDQVLVQRSVVNVVEVRNTSRVETLVKVTPFLGPGFDLIGGTAGATRARPDDLEFLGTTVVVRGTGLQSD